MTNTKNIQPHEAFQYVSPDDIANCWDEANMDVCIILHKGMKAMDELTSGQNKEDGWCPTSWSCEFNMAHPHVWSAFTESEKHQLNAMAEQHDIAHNEYMEKLGLFQY